MSAGVQGKAFFAVLEKEQGGGGGNCGLSLYYPEVLLGEWQHYNGWGPESCLFPEQGWQTGKGCFRSRLDEPMR